MAQSFTTIRSGEEICLTEKNSRFLGQAFHVTTPEEAAEALEPIRRKYYDARHHCYAYVLSEGGLERAADDGEPQGTAGKPILSAIHGAELMDVLIVVTRYFGGTLLGTGGLTRAYGGAAAMAIQAAEISVMTDAVEMTVDLPYGAYDKVRYLLENAGIVPADQVFTDRVRLVLELAKESAEYWQEELMKASAREAVIAVKDLGFRPI